VSAGGTVVIGVLVLITSPIWLGLLVAVVINLLGWFGGRD
jgi:hypothetical protein